MAARYSLRGRTVLITGPARGIGAETARQVARKGARLGLAGLEPDRLAELAEEIGPDAAWFEADVRDMAAMERAVAGTVGRFGGIDVVIANAGIARVGTLADVDPADFEDTIQVNLLGVYRTIRAALPHVVERRGYVLAVASLAAAVHLPLMTAYAAAKAGVSAMCDGLRVELEPTGTKVGVAYFGFIDTDMTRRALQEPAARDLPATQRRLLVPKLIPVRGRRRHRRWDRATGPIDRPAEVGPFGGGCSFGRPADRRAGGPPHRRHSPGVRPTQVERSAGVYSAHLDALTSSARLAPRPRPS